jgi:DNA-binding transcriptional ArsR family regulator
MVPTASFNETMWFAIAEPSRRKLIELLLANGESTASRLAQSVPFSRQAVSKHMAVLRRAGLIAMRKKGKEVRFSIDPQGINLATRQLSEAAALWDTRLQAIKVIAEALHRKINGQRNGEAQ